MDTKDRILESILSNVRTEVSEFMEVKSKITCPVEYESKVVEIARNFARTMVAKSQGKVTKSRNLKKSSYLYWQIKS